MKETAAHRRVRFAAVREAFEMHAGFFQVSDEIDQALHAPAETIQLPDNQGVKRPHVRQRFGEAGPVNRRAALFVGEDFQTAGLLLVFPMLN